MEHLLSYKMCSKWFSNLRPVDPVGPVHSVSIDSVKKASESLD